MNPALIAGGLLVGGVVYLAWRRRGPAPSSDGEGPVTLSTPRHGPAADPWEPEAGSIGAQIGASAGFGRIPERLAAQTTVAGPGRPGWLVDRGYFGRGFGMRTTRTGARRPHSAIDITARTGQPIRVIMAGVVEHAGWVNGYGNCVLVRHDTEHLSSFYAHASQLLVAAGEVVQGGQPIALVGATGFDRMGPHLHTSVHQNLPPGARMTTDVEARYGIDPGPFWASRGLAMVREIGE